MTKEEKAKQLSDRANKFIEAALQVDPDAGEMMDGRTQCPSWGEEEGKWLQDNYGSSFGTLFPLAACVHTEEQCEAMAKLLNEWGVK